MWLTIQAASGKGVIALAQMACCAQHVWQSCSQQRILLADTLRVKFVAELTDCSACCGCLPCGTVTVLQGGVLSDVQEGPVHDGWCLLLRHAPAVAGCPAAPPPHTLSVTASASCGLARQGALQDACLAAAVGAGGVSLTGLAALHDATCGVFC